MDKPPVGYIVTEGTWIGYCDSRAGAVFLLEKRLGERRLDQAGRMNVGLFLDASLDKTTVWSTDGRGFHIWPVAEVLK